jgi:hypothetical protein
MTDVEAYNQMLVSTGGFSESQVKKRLQVIKQIIDRAGRPEHGGGVSIGANDETHTALSEQHP